MCFKYNTINILRNLWLCNDCGHKFIDEEDIEGNRAGFSREAEAEEHEDSTEIAERYEQEYENRKDDESEFDGALSLDDEDILFPPDDL